MHIQLAFNISPPFQNTVDAAMQNRSEYPNPLSWLPGQNIGVHVDPEFMAGVVNSFLQAVGCFTASAGSKNEANGVLSIGLPGHNSFATDSPLQLFLNLSFSITSTVINNLAGKYILITVAFFREFDNIRHNTYWQQIHQKSGEEKTMRVRITC